MEENQIQIPEGWAKLYLNEIFEFKYGANLPTIDFSTDGFPVYGANGIIGFHSKFNYINSEILISCRGENSGVINVSKEKAFITNNSIVCKYKFEVDKVFFYYNLKTIDRLKMVSGSAQPQVVIKDLNKIDIVFPKSIAEQQNIATILSKTDQAIAHTEALIAKYTRIKTGLMQDLLTKGIDENGNIRTEQTHEFKDSPLGRIPKEWECILIDDLANLKSGGTPSRQNSSFWNGDIPWVKTGEVNYNLIKETEEYITEKGLKMSSTVLFPKGTILMALYGQGKTRGRVSTLDIDATTNQACVGFLNLKKVTTNFLYFTLTHEYEKLRDLSNDGAQKNLSSGLLKKYFLKIPSDIKEQERIDELFARIDNSIIKEQYSLSKLQSIKTGLMQDLLSGKVRVNNLKLKEANETALA
ncbi:MAG: restriction endonuclease subunit S [Phycisphaerales bacterium]|nr:restriction endonuclease subunit S [Phycisphaerales bacterium]